MKLTRNRGLPVAPLVATAVVLVIGLAYWGWPRLAGRQLAPPPSGTVRVVAVHLPEGVISDERLADLTAAIKSQSPHVVALTGPIDPVQVERLIGRLGAAWVGETVPTGVDGAGHRTAMLANTSLGPIDRAVVPVGAGHQALVLELRAADGLTRVISLGQTVLESPLHVSALFGWMDRRRAGVSVVVAPAAQLGLESAGMAERFQRLGPDGDSTAPPIYVAPKSAAATVSRFTASVAGQALPMVLVDVRRP